MNQPPTGTSRAMAKTSKTVMLHEDICALIEAHAERTGASLTKIVTAALLQYFNSDPVGPPAVWMRMTMRTEKGELSPAQVGQLVAEDAVGRCIVHARTCKERVERGGERHQLGLDQAYTELAEARDLLSKWQSAAECADDPVAALIAYWDKNPYGPRPYRDILGPDAEEPSPHTDTDDAPAGEDQPADPET